MQKRKKYTKEFKLEALQLMEEPGKTVAEVDLFYFAVKQGTIMSSQLRIEQQNSATIHKSGSWYLMIEEISEEDNNQS